ncbi:MAG: hypothetical protein EBR29_08440 [Sphingobacteriia bacterium]|nr:hypothetical protein [Sphingobacteriia bacterium]
MLGRRMPIAPRGLLASRPKIKKTAFLLMGVFFTLISYFWRSGSANRLRFSSSNFLLSPHSLPYEDPSHATES